MEPADNNEALRQRAYEIWEAEGRPHGREREHWAQALRELSPDDAPEPDTLPADSISAEEAPVAAGEEDRPRPVD